MSTARQVADQIQIELEAGVAPREGLIGTEAELRLRHGVSLATLRQAIRILEQRQVAAMRRGVNGGLYAQQPSIDATANYVVALWERSDVPTSTTMHDVLVLHELMLRRASDCMTLADAGAIADLHGQCRATEDPIARSALATTREQAIAQLTGNPVIMLGQAAMLRYLRNVIPFEEIAWDDPAFADRMNALVDDKIAALIAGDVLGATQAWHQYTQDYLARMEMARHGAARPGRVGAAAAKGSLPMLVSRSVLRDIRERGWQAGEFLGQEAELIQRYNVGRNTWRQALSILFEYSAVESRRGGAGGLYVAPINRDAVMQTAGDWLARQGANPAHGLELFSALAPHYAAKVFMQDEALSDGNRGGELTCADLLDSVLRREPSPLLALAAVPITSSVLKHPSPVGLADFRDGPFATELVRRAILMHLAALREIESQDPRLDAVGRENGAG